MFELIEAINLKVQGTGALLVGLRGGFNLDHPAQATYDAMPFAVLVGPIGAAPEYNTGATFIQPADFQISFFGRTTADIRPIIERFRLALNRQPLALSRGRVMQALLTNESLTYEPGDEDAVSAWHGILEFTFTQTQSTG